MDPRFEKVLAEQQRLRFPGISGSELGGTIRVSDQLLNQFVAASLPPDGVVRALQLRSRAGNWLNVKLSLAKPAFMPPLNFELTIDRQPELPHDPVVVLRFTGGAGAVLKLASSALERSVALPPGVRLSGDRVHVDIRALLQQRGQAALLDYVQQLCVSTEEAGVAVIIRARVS